MARLRIPGWSDFQHYKGRNPPWIKLHKKLLDNYEFHCLPVASRALAPMLWLLASESETGLIDYASTKLAFRLRMASEDFEAALKPLISAGFIEVEQDASRALAPCKPDAIPETEEETESETDSEKESISAADASLAKPKADRGSRLPEDWKPTDELMAWARENFPGVVLAGEAGEVAKFRRYWSSKSGKDATKTNWPMTFQNWVTKAAEYRPNGGKAPPVASVDPLAKAKACANAINSGRKYLRQNFSAVDVRMAIARKLTTAEKAHAEGWDA